MDRKCQARSKKIIEYLEDEWPVDIAEKFIDKLDSILELLANSPYIGMVSTKRKGVRQILITRHNKCIIKKYAVGGDVAAIFYIEPLLTHKLKTRFELLRRP